jgi:hypothetical protein
VTDKAIPRQHHVVVGWMFRRQSDVSGEAWLLFVKAARRQSPHSTDVAMSHERRVKQSRVEGRPGRKVDA